MNIAGREISKIGPGILVLLGVEKGDTEKEARWMADKVSNLRIFEDECGKMNRSVIETGGACMVVSQFTLLGDAKKGRRPSFERAEKAEAAKNLYKLFIAFLKEKGLVVREGEFGAFMEIELVNSGPVTMILDTPSEEGEKGR